MNRTRRIRPIRRVASALAVLAGALLASSATVPAAFATRVPPPAPAPAHTIVVVGMPGWQITLIAVGAAVFAAAVAVILDRARATRRHLTASSA